MNLFNKSRPQSSFEGVWCESAYVAYLIWEMTLTLHSADSEEVRENFLNFLNEKSQEMLRIGETLYKTRREIVDIFYKNLPEPHKEKWYSFVQDLRSFQENTNTNLIRLFILKDILLQIDEKHPKRKEIEKVLQESFENLLKAKKEVEKITKESEKSYQAIYDAIVIARSINDDVSLDEAERRERKRWE